jgi:AcrR family transcriptional regulator
MVDSAVAKLSDSGPSRRPRRRPGENRERLILSGLHCFGIYGFHAASTAEIARLAGVPQPHVYANFTTKQTLFLACVERACRLLTEVPAPRADTAAMSAREAATSTLFHAIADLGAIERLDSAAAAQCREMIAQLRHELGKREFTNLLTQAASHLLIEPE